MGATPSWRFSISDFFKHIHLRVKTGLGNCTLPELLLGSSPGKKLRAITASVSQTPVASLSCSFAAICWLDWRSARRFFFPKAENNSLKIRKRAGGIWWRLLAKHQPIPRFCGKLHKNKVRRGRDMVPRHKDMTESENNRTWFCTLVQYCLVL